MPKCDSCITGEAFHTKAFRLCRPAIAIEISLDLCPICFAVSNQLYAALVRKEPFDDRKRSTGEVLDQRTSP